MPAFVHGESRFAIHLEFLSGLAGASNAGDGWKLDTVVDGKRKR